MLKIDIKGDINKSTLDLIKNAISQDDNDITLNIDSNGGSLYYGMLAYDSIRESGKNFYANVVGSCMSSATLLLVACPLNNRTASAHSTILIHNPLVNVGMTSLNDMKSLVGSMEDAKAKLVQIYAERTLMLADEVSTLMDKEQELYGLDAVKKGLIAKTNELYNYKKIGFRNNMKKSFIQLIANKVVSALLRNEAYTAEDGTELEISELVVGGTCSQDGVFVVEGSTITVEGGVIVDIITPTTEEISNEEEPTTEEVPTTTEEVAEEVAEVVEEVVEDEEITDATEIAEVVKEVVEEQLAELTELRELVEKCGGKDKLKNLANIKHTSKNFESKQTKIENKGGRSIADLMALKKR